MVPTAANLPPPTDCLPTTVPTWVGGRSPAPSYWQASCPCQWYSLLCGMTLPSDG